MSLAQSPPQDLSNNPLGTKGFEFVEFHSPQPDKLKQLFEALGFRAVAKHRNIPLTLYSQGRIKLFLNESAVGFSADFSNIHGPCACGMAFRVKNADYAKNEILKQRPDAEHEYAGSLDSFQLPTISGIGSSKLYLVDEQNYESQVQSQLVPIHNSQGSNDAGLSYIDHLTHNVGQGQMDVWAYFYQDLFNFHEVRYFDIQGSLTGLLSRAMCSPCGRIKIPINEAKDKDSQIEEFLRDYNGEGIQHIALGTADIYHAVEVLADNGIKFLDVPDTYYEDIEKRLPNHGEEIAKLQKYKILIDGKTGSEPPKLLLQIFTDTVIGPIFFEIIQRKGDKGFGEGNFKALFESIERDQIRRGILKT